MNYTCERSELMPRDGSLVILEYRREHLLNHFFQTLDVTHFLLHFDTMQFIRANICPANHTYTSKEEFMSDCSVRGYSNESPEDTFKHESAHKDAATDFGIRSTLRVVGTEDHYWIAYTELDIDDLRGKVAGDPHRLAHVMGNIMQAPYQQGVYSYEKENTLAQKLLDMATQSLNR